MSVFSLLAILISAEVETNQIAPDILPLDELLLFTACSQELYDTTQVINSCSHHLASDTVKSGDRSELLRVRAMLFINARLPKAALDDIKQSSGSGSPTPEISWLKARALAMRGSTAEAIQICDQLITSDSEFTPALLTRSVLHLNQNKTDKALALLNQAISIDPHSQYAYYIRASILLVKKNLDAALSDICKALVLAPDEFGVTTVEIIYRRGQIQMQRKAWKMAAADFVRVYRLDPNHAAAKYWIWKSNWLLRNFPVAARIADELIREFPNSPQMLDAASKSFAVTGDSQRAIDTATRWSQLEPGNLKAQLQLAVALTSAQKHDEALGHLNRILRKSPRHHGALAQKSWLLLSSHDPGIHDAASSLANAIALHEAGGSKFVSGYLAAAAASTLGNIEDAEKWLKVAGSGIQHPVQQKPLIELRDVIRKRLPIRIGAFPGNVL